MRTLFAIVTCLFAAACSGASSSGPKVTPSAPWPVATQTTAAAAPSAAALSSAAAGQSAAEQEADAFVKSTVDTVRPLRTEANRAWYQASITGTDEDFAKSTAAENAVLRFYSDPARFARVKTLRALPGITDPLLRRELDMLYLEMLGKQVEPALLEQITALGSEVEQAFNTYRGKLRDREVTQNEINEILRTSTDSKALREAWEAQKGVGALVAPKLKRLVVLRNEVARKLGFRDFYAMRMAENELDEDKLLALFADLDRLTRDAFLGYKAEVDARLSKRLKVPAPKLMAWHYQNPFFQEPPAVFNTGLDEIYEKQDPLALCRSFYTSIGLEIEDVLGRSDLYEKKGKSPHAFSQDIDRQGDVRILANIVPGFEWQSTMMHELGHAVYSKYLDPSLPWLLRNETHPLTTEGIAMMFEELSGNPNWAAALGIIDAAARERALPEARSYLAFAPLQFSRWTLVMLHFERELYRDPEQDLNRLWWDLVEKFQGLHRPEKRDAPDYASKIHLVVAPVYYQNYMLGQLFASQLRESLAALEKREPFDAVFYKDPQVGEYLRTRIFAPGARYPWNELVEKATGKPLGPEAFARRFGKK